MKTTDHPAYRLDSVPVPPDALSEDAKQQWLTLAPLIYEMQTARIADLPTLELLCEIKADVHSLEEAIRDEGYTIEAGSGGRKAHPAMQTLTATRRQAQNLLDKFGLVPGSEAPQAREYSDYYHEHHYE